MAVKMFVGDFSSAEFKMPTVLPKIEEEESLDSQINRSALETQLEAAQKAGLIAVSMRIMIQLSKPERDRERELARLKNEAKTKYLEQVGATRLSKKDYEVWCGWLPREYRDGVLSSQYAYDTPPLRVMEMIGKLKEMELFDSLTVRTPEKAQTDPALFGRLGMQWYLLAQWGESDESLIGFEQIKSGVKARRQFGQLIPVCLLLLVVFGYVLAVDLITGASVRYRVGNEMIANTARIAVICGAICALGLVGLLRAFYLRIRFKYAFGRG